MCIPLLVPGDIRYRWELAGGAAMDVGCYTINLVRFLAGAEPEVVRAEARLSSPRVDRWMTADFRFADGRTGRITCSLFSVHAAAHATRSCAASAARCASSTRSHRTSTTASACARRRHARVERVAGDATYTHQLRAFVDAVRTRRAAADRCRGRRREHARDRRGVREGGAAAARHVSTLSVVRCPLSVV